MSAFSQVSSKQNGSEASTSSSLCVRVLHASLHVHTYTLKHTHYGRDQLGGHRISFLGIQRNYIPQPLLQVGEAV